MLKERIFQQHSLLAFAAIILLPLLVTSGLGLENSAMIALFFTIVVLWFTELIPLAATGLLVPSLAVLYGITDAKQAFSAFGNQILFLFIGAFLIGKSMQKHGWDQRMAYFILASKFGCQSPGTLTMFIAVICWILSMWISNTAACVIMVPICLGILVTLKESFPSEKYFQRFTYRLLLICAFASSIGGLATPVGTPPNLLAIQFLADRGITISFLQWMLIGLPISLCMLACLLFFLAWKYAVPHINLDEVREQFRKKLGGMGPIKTAEKQVAFCFLMAIVLWIAPGLLKLSNPENTLFNEVASRLPMGSVALFAALLLFCLPVNVNGANTRNLSWHDAKEIDWGTVLLFGGGLCLGNLLNETGLAQSIGEFVFSTDIEAIWLYGLLAIIIAVLLSEFSSNTASAAIIIPIIIGSFSSLGDTILTQLVIATAFGASYGFMLPVSTPPNAIIYGTGRLPLQQMIRCGVVFDIMGYLLIAVFMLGLFPLLGFFKAY